MDKDTDKNSANSEEELPEKELSEMDVKKIMIFRQIGAKIAYYRTLRQMTQAELAKRANLSKGSIGRIDYSTSLKVFALIWLLSLLSAKKRKKFGGKSINICCNLCSIRFLFFFICTSQKHNRTGS